MALETVRTQKMRSALTVLGVVIGITSIVGMTAIIRGFDESLRESILQLGADTIFVTQFSGVSLAANEDFSELMRRPSLTVGDGEAIGAQSPSIAEVALILGHGGRSTQTGLSFEGRRTKSLSIFGTTDNYPEVMHLDVEMGRFFTAGEVSHRHRVVVLGQTPYQALFPKIDPIGRTVRIGNVPYSVIGVLGSRPSPGGLNVGQDDLAVISHSAYQKQFGVSVRRSWRGRLQSVLIAAVPRENVMRIRHGLRLDEANDFDLLTQDSVLRLWERISSATFLALVSISSIALMVGGIGVMAIMTISVKERTREIGTRRALGARRREILQQFLLEAVFLTGIGGILGVVLGSGVGVAVHLITEFPISLPWWSFALGVGFSGTVGIVFGLFPAIRASGLNPIEALRYE